MAGAELLLLLACVAKDEAFDSGLPLDSGPPADGSVTMTDAHNYAYDGSLDGPSYPLAELQDVSVSWADLHTDLQCHDLDPVADIDNVAVLPFPYLSETEVEVGLEEGTLDQVDIAIYVSYLPGDGTSASLSQFTFFGTEADMETRFSAGSGTWLVLLTTGTTVAAGARMIAFLTPTAGETDTVAELTDGCPVLDFDADLRSLTPLPILANGPWHLDWSGLTRDGRGGEFVSTRVNSLMVARFDRTVEELEARFLDIEAMAAETWTYDLTSGTSADLGTLSGPSEPFPGFDAQGVWLLALRCTICPNPAPVFLTVLAPG